MRRVTDFLKKSNKSESEQFKPGTSSEYDFNDVSMGSLSTSFEICNFPDSAEITPNSSNVPVLSCDRSARNDSQHHTFNFDLGTIESGPARPKLKKFPLTAFGKQNRSFSVSYYDMYQWLEYSIEQDAVFCYVCRIYNTNVSLADDVFTKSGFKNWKKIKDKLDKHGKCNVHFTALEKQRMSKQTKETGTVMTLMSSAHRQEVEQNVYYLNKVIDIIIYLSTQGLALRGHDEKVDSDNRGNFLELCQFFARHDNKFKEGFDKTLSFCSKRIQNEIIDLISIMTTERIIEEVKLCGFFSIMVDEARCRREQQLSFCIRYVDNELVPHERFLLFKDCSSDRNAEDLACLVLNIIQGLGLSNLKIVAQTYDGASVMSGDTAGLQRKIRDNYPEAVYYHCYAHKVALVVTDVCRFVERSNLLFNGLEALYVHFSRPSHHAILKQTADLLRVKKPFEITAQSTTRWTCRYKNCEQLIKNFGSVKEALRFEIEKCEDSSAIEAEGLFNTITSTEFVVYLFIFHYILTHTHVLSKQLQHDEATLGGASHVIKGTIKTLKEKRSDVDFSVMWKKITSFADEHDICLENFRSSKRKKQGNVLLKNYLVLSTIGSSHSQETEHDNQNAEDYWKSRVYFRVLDVVIERLSQRFNEESLELANSIDGLFDLDFGKSKCFLEKYGGSFQINSHLLEAEMAIAKNCIADQHSVLESPSRSESDKKIIRIRRKFEAIRREVRKETFPNLFQAIRLAAAIPISSASCERSFSAMRRIKNWLRTTMHQERFSNLALLYIEKRLLKQSICTQSVVERFALKPRKLHLK